MRTAHLGGRFRYQYVQQSQQVLNATLCVTICCSWCACPGLSSALSCCWQICYCMSWRGQIMTFVIIAMCSSPCAAVRALQQLTSRSALQSLSSSQRSFPLRWQVHIKTRASPCSVAQGLLEFLAYEPFYHSTVWRSLLHGPLEGKHPEGSLPLRSLMQGIMLRRTKAHVGQSSPITCAYKCLTHHSCEPTTQRDCT